MSTFGVTKEQACGLREQNKNWIILVEFQIIDAV